jgi:hypothetical protein
MDAAGQRRQPPCQRPSQPPLPLPHVVCVQNLSLLVYPSIDVKLDSIDAALQQHMPAVAVKGGVQPGAAGAWAADTTACRVAHHAWAASPATQPCTCWPQSSVCVARRRLRAASAAAAAATCGRPGVWLVSEWLHGATAQHHHLPAARLMDDDACGSAADSCQSTLPRCNFCRPQLAMQLLASGAKAVLSR